MVASVDLAFVGFMVFMIAVAGFVIYYAAHVPPLTYTLVDYWSTNDTCKALINMNRNVRPASKLAFISDDGILIFTYNASIEDVGFLYTANGACPDWLPYAEIHPVDP